MAEDLKPLILIGGIGILGYYAYSQGWLSSLFGTTAAAPATGTPAGTSAAPGAAASPPATGSAPPAGPTSTGRTLYGTPAPVVKGMTNTGSTAAAQAQQQAALVANLLAAAGVPASQIYTIDQWNYFLPAASPGAAILDSSTVGIARGTPAFSMTAAQYVAYRAQAGLMSGLQGLGATFGVPAHWVNAARWGM